MIRLPWRRSGKRTLAGETTLEIDGRSVPLRIKRDGRARRLTLRIDTMSDAAVVTLPPWVPVREGMDLAIGEASWILAKLDARPVRVAFVDGAAIPILGMPHRIVHRPDRSGGAWIEDGIVSVTGRPEHLARRVTDCLKREARRHIAHRAEEKAARLGCRHGRISIRDTTTLWGSCSPKGDLSFCWRLVMAPEFVLDYVVAHEVAHLKNRTHGPGFWKIVQELTDDTGAARRWLCTEGESLHRYG